MAVVSARQWFSMSVVQYEFSMSVVQYVRGSVCQLFSMSGVQYVSGSVCQYVGG